MSNAFALKPLLSAGLQPELFAQLRPDVSRLLTTRMVMIWAVLLTFGLVMVASSSIAFADSTLGDPWYFTRRHFIFLAMALTLSTAVAMVPLAVWQKYAWVLLILAFVLLLNFDFFFFFFFLVCSF